MNDYQLIPLPREPLSVPLRVVVDRKPDLWVAYCPALLAHGICAAGATRQEALENLRHALDQQCLCITGHSLTPA